MKANTQNEYQRKVNEVIDYINANLHKSLKLDYLAGMMCVSSYHFHRIMRAYLNEPLSAYITRQRLERAAMYLKSKDRGINELTEMVGYATPQSFSKAFKQYFGVAPTAFKKGSKPDSFLIQKSSVFKRLTLDCKIQNISDMNMVYIRIFGKYGEKKSYTKAWKKLSGFIKDNDLLNESTRWFGISHDDPNITKGEQLRYYACATVSEDIQPYGEFGVYTISEGKFAVYTHRGGYDGLQNLYDNIYCQMKYLLRDDTSFEEYLNSPHNTREEDLLTKVYIPIV